MQRYFINKIKILAILFIIFPVILKASDWSCIVNLSGSWYFSVGDDPAWASPNTDVSDWDKIYVPGEWEEYYKDYDGYAWYRKNFDLHSYPKNGKLTLILGKIDDVDEVFINGVKVGQTGSFFPHYKTAYDTDRKYDVSEEILKPTGNVIAVRVYDEGLSGGIVNGNEIGIFYDNDYALLNYDLSGLWKFSIFREPGIKEINFNDKDWKTIKVPSYWESQGFPDYDGYAWYRKEFTLPGNLSKEDFYLSLGKIDDMDKVYLNGKMIGRTEDLKLYDRYGRSNACNLYRLYRIPNDLLETKNVLVVEVYDGQQMGGIYEGPIGLMTRNNTIEIEDRNENDYWPTSIHSIIKSIFNW